MKKANSNQSVFAALHRRLDEADQYALDERAAILEYDAGYSREEAESLAMAEFIAANRPEPIAARRARFDARAMEAAV